MYYSLLLIPASLLAIYLKRREQKRRDSLVYLAGGKASLDPTATYQFKVYASFSTEVDAQQCAASVVLPDVDARVTEDKDKPRWFVKWTIVTLADGVAIRGLRRTLADAANRHNGGVFHAVATRVGAPVGFVLAD